MAKKASTAYLDAPLDYLSGNATRLIVTDAEPADRAAALAAELAGGAIGSGALRPRSPSRRIWRLARAATPTT